MPTRALGRPAPPPPRDHVVVKGPGSAARIGRTCPLCRTSGLAIFGQDYLLAECIRCGHRQRVQWQGGAR